jgi:hypothetical protein
MDLIVVPLQTQWLWLVLHRFVDSKAVVWVDAVVAAWVVQIEAVVVVMLEVAVVAAGVKLAVVAAATLEQATVLQLFFADFG